MALPANLTFFSSRLEAGVSTQYFKLQPNVTGTQRAGQTIRFELPGNILLSTRSLSMQFIATTGGHNAGARLPAKIESLVERISVEAGGVQLNSACNGWNVIRNMKDCVLGSVTPALTGHPSAVRQRNVLIGPIAGTENETYAFTGQPFSIHFWDSMLSSIEPSVLDTSLLPPISISITMASNEVLASVAGVDRPGGAGIRPQIS